MEQITSRAQYWKWWDTHNPRELPRNPNWVYSEWEGWSVFLGTGNKFNTDANPHQYVPYDDAMSYARASQISSQSEWIHYDKHPPNIPVRPDIVYRKRGFMGWKYFLGIGKHKTTAKIEEARRREKEKEKEKVLLFALPVGNSPNQVHISVHRDVEMAKHFLNTTHCQFIKAFKLESGYDWRRVVANHASDYGNGEWLVGNINQLLFEINLEWIR